MRISDWSTRRVLFRSGLLVGALALAGCRLLDDRPRAAGILFGLMTIKPHLGILIALVLLVQRRWTAIIYAALTFGALFLVSSALFGFNTWSVYLLHTLGRSEEHTSELQSLMRISYALFCLKTKNM